MWHPPTALMPESPTNVCNIKWTTDSVLHWHDHTDAGEDVNDEISG
jgi:hypothetical protein